MPGEACPWKKTWSPPPGWSGPRKKWFMPTSYSVAADAYVEMWPPTETPGPLGAVDHDGGIPADHPAVEPLDVLVAGEPRLLLGADRVDEVGGRERGHADLLLPGPLEQPEHDVPGAGPTADVEDLVEGVQPLLGLTGVGVGQVGRNAVEDGSGFLAERHERSSRRELWGDRGCGAFSHPPPRVCAGTIPSTLSDAATVGYAGAGAVGQGEARDGQDGSAAGPPVAVEVHRVRSTPCRTCPCRAGVPFGHVPEARGVVREDDPPRHEERRRRPS